MARKVVNRLFAIKKHQFYNNKVLCTSSTKGNIFRDVDEITRIRAKSKQISLRIKDNAFVDDGETVADLFNEYFTTIAGSKLD